LKSSICNSTTNHCSFSVNQAKVLGFRTIKVGIASAMDVFARLPTEILDKAILQEFKIQHKNSTSSTLVAVGTHEGKLW
jgi:hypothetical protein